MPGSERREEAVLGDWARRASEAARGEPSLLEREIARNGDAG